MLNILIIILSISLLFGCMPDVPDVPTTAICTDDRFLFDPVTGQFILNQEGGALTCDLQ